MISNLILSKLYYDFKILFFMCLIRLVVFFIEIWWKLNEIMYVIFVIIIIIVV